MRTINRRIGVITNIILFVVIIAVFAVGFIPEKIVAIYGGNGINAIYHGNIENKNVSLMFNVYENTEVVDGILTELSIHDVKATFFVGGCWADDNGEMLAKIVGAGHEIANHGYFHKDHKKLDYKGNYDEIFLTGVIVKALCNEQLSLFAPPSGSFSETTLEVAYELGYKVIMWSKDTIDWRDSDLNKIINRATKNPTNGDFILMHPKSHTLKALPEIIKFYKNLGFNLVTVSENLK